MATRRILLGLIGLLTAFILLCGAGVGVMTYVAMARLGAGSLDAGQLLILGADQQLRLVAAGGEERVVADDASPDLFRYPTMAPDGERIAYISQDSKGFALHSLHLKSGDRTELYRSSDSPPLYAAWSPDGTNISFLSNQSAGGLAVHIVPADGSAEPSTIGAAASSSYFAWQPGGEQILLHLGGSSFERGTVATYAMGSSTPLHELADPGFFQAPAWSIDGASFYYVAQPPVSGQPTPDSVESVLTRVAADGSEPQVLASEKMAAMLFLRAPNSDDIAYTTVGPAGFGPLKIVDPDGGATRTLSRAEERVPAFFWSPAGDRIAYLSLSQETGAPPRFTWHVVDRDGSLTDMASFTPSPAFTALVNFFDAYVLSFDLWSADGRELVYGAQDGVYVLNAASGEAQRRADGVLGMWVGPR